ncbi:unnamed protein product [Parnassius mnemosyne]
MSEEGLTYYMDEVKIHEYYRHLSEMDNDIALLLLKDHVEFSFKVKKAILVEPETVLRDNTHIRVSGWSTSKLAPKFRNVLLRTEMIVINKTECITYYGKLITPSNYCAKYNSEYRIFDIGGPAIFQDLLVGIVSFGVDNKKEPYYTVFTNISHFYR